MTKKKFKFEDKCECLSNTMAGEGINGKFILIGDYEALDFSEIETKRYYRCQHTFKPCVGLISSVSKDSDFKGFHKLKLDLEIQQRCPKYESG